MGVALKYVTASLAAAAIAIGTIIVLSTPDKPHKPIRYVAVTTTSTTSTTLPPTTLVAAPRPPTTRASRNRVVSPAPAYMPHPCGNDVWAALAWCESHCNTAAVGGGGRYFGAFQFSLTTWHSLDLSGSPLDYSYDDQRAAAIRLVARSGWGQFPVCGRRVA